MCCTCLYLDADQAPGVWGFFSLGGGVFFNFLYEDLHFVDAKSWMVL